VSRALRHLGVTDLRQMRSARTFKRLIQAGNPMNNYELTMADSAFEDLIYTEPFGRGTARVAYDVRGNREVIVKKSIRTFPGSNMLEWFIWNSASQADDPTLSNLLGRCISISETGKYLMMERLADIDQGDYANIPNVPVWFNDPKPCAFGKNKNGIKIRDYGMTTPGALVRTDLVAPPAFAIEARLARSMRPGT